MLSLTQKTIKINNKVYYIFYLKKYNKIIDRLGYILILTNVTVVRLNLKKLFNYLYLYKGILKIKEKIYIKFFLLFYCYLIKVKSKKIK